MGILLGAVQTPPAGSFASDTVIHADIGTVLGTVPIEYSGYQCLRTVAHHINADIVCSFDIDIPATLVYVHISLNDADTYRPDLLTDWTNTGDTAVFAMPGRDSTKSDLATGTYYTRALGSGTVGWSWASSGTVDEMSSYYVGCFLIPPGVTVSNIFPETYDIIDDITAAYSPLAKDWWWNPAPTSRGATTSTATSWQNLGTLINAASPGDIIELPAGTYNDDGTITLTVAGDEDNPIIVCGPETDLTQVPTAVLTGGTKAVFTTGCRGVRLMHMKDTGGTGNSGDERFVMSGTQKWNSIENIWWDESTADTASDSWEYVQISGGEYWRVSNIGVGDKNGRGNCINIVPVTGDNDGNRFGLVQYCKFDGFNTLLTGWSGQNNAFLRVGGNNNFLAKGYHFLRRNHFENWNEVVDDAEYMVIKSEGTICSENVYISNTNNQTSTGMFPRVGSRVLGVGNYFQANSNSKPTSGIQLYGNDDGGLPSRHLYMRNYCDGFDGTNGFLSANQVNSDNRWVAKECLVTELYMPDATDECLAFRGTSGNLPEDIYLKRIALKTTTDAVQEHHDSSLGVTFEACAFSWGPDHGFDVSGFPSGITNTDPNFADRGDGVKVSDRSELDSVTINDCCPANLQGPIITNLGTTFTSV